MFGIFVAFVFGVILVGIVLVVQKGEQPLPMVALLLFSYVLRLILQNYLRDAPFFTSSGLDCVGYEIVSRESATLWTFEGVHYLDSDHIPSQGGSRVTLPINLFALIIYLNGGITRIGCVSVVAFLACMTCFNLYRLSRLWPVTKLAGLRIMVLLLFSPSYLFHTSDMFKDGFVAFLVTGAFASAVRLSRVFTFRQAGLGVSYLIALWHVRHYLVFAALLPFMACAISFRVKHIMRTSLILLATIVGTVAAIAFTDTVTHFRDEADKTFTYATSDKWREVGAQGGSGVTIEGGGSFPLKLLYTLFSPFLWQSGSIGMQIGKIEALFWYYIAYHAFRGAKIIWRDDRSLFFIFVFFVVPTTIVYAMSFSNIGLIVRQRMPIIFVSSAIATFSLSQSRMKKGQLQRRHLPLAESTGAAG